MFWKKCVLLFLLSLPLLLKAQEKVPISGYLTDANSGEALLYANVYVKNSTNGVTTNEYGYFSLEIPKGASVTVVFSYIGYQSKEEIIRNPNSTNCTDQTATRRDQPANGRGDRQTKRQ